jgi:Putative Ig domain
LIYSGCNLGKVLKSVSMNLGLTLVSFLLGCGSGVFQLTGVPSISQILPQTIAAGSPALTMKVTGTNFTSQSVILWNGTALTTSVVDSNTVSGKVSSSIVSTPSTVQLKVQNGEAGLESQAVPLVVAPPAAVLTPSISPAPLPSATVGLHYSATIAATGETPSVLWSMSSGSLPSGLSLAAASGIISGTPTVSGKFSFGVKVNNLGSSTNSASATLTLTVAAATPAALAIVTATLPGATLKHSYSSSLQASGGTAPYTWSIRSGSLPAGLSLSANSGAISGTPTASGTFKFTVAASDSSSPAQTKSAAMSIVVAAVPVATLTITSSTLPSGTAGKAYSTALSASGGTHAYTWSITSGSLPAGLSLSASGAISGTPKASGTFKFTVAASDSSSPAQTTSAAMSIVVATSSTSTLTITSSTLPSGTVGTAYSAAPQVSGGTPAYTWSIPSGSLPAGLTMSATTGVISGTPSVTGTSNFTVTVTDNSNPAQTKSAAVSIVVAAHQATGPGTTWYVRTDGGTRYSSNVTTGQCDGQADVAYSGSGTNQHCAFNDFRYLWDDDSGAVGQGTWVIAGGDTVVIRGCTALASQQNPSNPDCRLGWDMSTGSAPNRWCYGIGSYGCYNPPIPAGSASQHTRILGQCVLAGNCNTGNVTNRANLSHLFAGFSLGWGFNVGSTQYVDVEGIELTTHNHATAGGNCTYGVGAPANPVGCSSSQPLDDFAQNGFLTNNTTSNITFQDVYVDGFDSAGFFGPIGGPIVMTRVNSSFNAFAGWNFDDGHSTPDAPGSSITASYVTMNWNGCYQEYPIVHAIPARVCYDTNSEGFGDSWSGQNTTLDSFICDHCVSDYNTKDAFIGPHTWTTTLTITNSESIGNMGQSWKWGGYTVPTTVTFLNNLTVANCNRLSQPMTGAPSGYNQYLTGFCRAAGNAFAIVIPSGSTWTMANNTVVTYQPTIFDIACPTGVPGPCPSTVKFTNNIFLGYDNPSNPYGPLTPGLYYTTGSVGITLVATHNVEFGIRNDDCPTAGGSGNICSDPLLVGEPARGTVPPESTLDNFNFHLTSNSPTIGAGATYLALPSTDYFGTPTSNPPVIGAVGP